MNNHRNNYEKKYLSYFRNIDYFILNLITHKFKEISNYLNNKYSLLKNEKFISLNNSNLSKRKKKLFLYSVDLFSFGFHKKWLKDKLKDKFIIKFDRNKPDYLIYNVFGKEHLDPKYKNAIKVAIFTENKIPDFNEADYAIGHYHINYLDRYFKSSIFIWQDFNKYDFNDFRIKVLNSPKRLKFCGAVISNHIISDGFRIKFINELNKYKTIDMGGKYKNNIGKQVKNKIKFLASYKFSIAMENTEGNGYISEKIVDSFLAGTIPIYYGDYMIEEYINPKAFILIKGEKDMLKKIEYIKKIDNDDNLYKSLLKEKVLTILE